MVKGHGFDKSERLCGRKQIDTLFREGNRSVSCFPVRLVWMEYPMGVPGNIKVLISVPKRKLRHAVDRNRVKRQLRETYRIECDRLKMYAESKGKSILIGILFIDDNLWISSRLSSRLKSALDQLLSILPS